MNILMEAFLSALFLMTGKRNQRLYATSRKIHQRRREKLLEYGETCFPREEYEGTNEEYWCDLRKHRLETNLLLLVLLVIFVISCFLCPDFIPR
jgi:hypothetical protein